MLFSNKTPPGLNFIVYLLGTFSLVLLIGNLGFHLPPQLQELTNIVIWWVVALFIIQELIRWLFVSRKLEHYRTHFRARWFQNLLVIAIIVSFFNAEIIEWIQKGFPNATASDITLAYLGITQSLALAAQILAFMRGSSFISRITLTPSRLISLSFLIPICVGALLLKLPRATTEGISWLDALFTATSAVCITGLTVVDTQFAFTPLGQFFIALLMQAGGLGILTLSMGFGIFFSGGFGVRERILMSDVFSDKKIGEVGTLLTQVMVFTFTVEIFGALAIYLSAGHTFQNFDIIAFYSAAFHSISAFCNAGFSLLSQGLASEGLASNYLFGSAIMVLVFLGAIGFPVLSNLYDSVRTRQANWGGKIVLLSLSTKLILISTAVIISTGIALVYFLERPHSFSGLTQLESLYQSVFLIATSRTAGFNVFPTEALSIGTAFFLIVLMWIGGSPMSTAGGIKNITVAIAFLAVRARITGREHIEAFGRQIEDHSVIKAFAIIAASLAVLLISIISLIVLNPSHKPFDLAFEAVSAFGTVGLSRGLTSDLSDLSKALLILLMYTGRIGFLTVISTLYFGTKQKSYRLLSEKVPIP